MRGNLGLRMLLSCVLWDEAGEIATRLEGKSNRKRSSINVLASTPNNNIVNNNHDPYLVYEN